MSSTDEHTEDDETGDAPADTEHTEDAPTDDDRKPRGTLFIMILFLIMLVAMWSWVYFEMIAA